MAERPLPSGLAIPPSLAAVIADAIRYFAARPLPYVLLALLLQGPAYALVGAASGTATAEILGAVQRSASAEEAMCVALGATVPLLAGSLVSGLLYVLLAGASSVVLYASAARVPVSALEALRLTARRLRPLAGGTLLAVAVVGTLLAVPLGALGFIQGCYGGDAGAEAAAAIRQAAEAVSQAPISRVLVWLSLLTAGGYIVHAGVKWVVMPQAALVEGGDAAQVLWRSRGLVRGRWLAVAATLLGLIVAQSVLAGIVGLAGAALAAVAPLAVREPLRVALATLAQVVALPVGALGSALLYLHLRAIREGYTTADLAREMADLRAEPTRRA